jgi:hypothetical protein
VSLFDGPILSRTVVYSGRSLLPDDLQGRTPPERQMRFVDVLLDSVLLSQQVGLLERGELFNIQERIPEPADERFTNGFSQAEPGGCKPRCSHSCKALAMNTGPLSIRKCVDGG